jgi:hypothetical protein
MSTKVQIRRGSTSSANAFTGAEGELYVDTDQNDLRVHDGSTPGGFRLPNFNTVTELNSSKVDKIDITAGTVGSGSEIPVITYNEQGQITAVSTSTLNISNDYYDLTNRPFIPNLTSHLMNDAGFITGNGLANLHSTSEKISTKTNASGTVVHDFNDGAIWYHANMVSNFTVNLTNIPIATNRSIGIALILAQGNNAVIPDALQIDGVTQVINWQDSVIPTGDINSTNIVNFMLIRLSSSWLILASLSTYS